MDLSNDSVHIVHLGFLYKLLAYSFYVILCLHFKITFNGN